MSQGNCVVAGHICLDIIPEIRSQTGFLQAIQPGHLLSIGAPVMAPGGSVSNTGLALHKLGIETRLMSKLGDDSFGHELRSLLGSEDETLTGGLRAVTGEHTSYTIILSPPDADRVFLHSTGANDTFGPEDIDYATLETVDLFHFGYPTAMARMVAGDGLELSELLRKAHETRVTTSLDTSMFDPQGPFGATHWPTLLDRALPYVDIFLPSLDEVLLMLEPSLRAGKPDPELCRSLAERLLARGASIVVLKQGQNGLYLRTANEHSQSDNGRVFALSDRRWRDRELWAPAFRVEVVGTTGAGDCAIGGFLASILRGLGPEEALVMAAAVGACNVEAADATSGIRSWDQTLKRIAAGWQQHDLLLPRWSYNNKAKLWIGPADQQQE